MVITRMARLTDTSSRTILSIFCCIYFLTQISRSWAQELQQESVSSFINNTLLFENGTSIDIPIDLLLSLEDAIDEIDVPDSPSKDWCIEAVSSDLNTQPTNNAKSNALLFAVKNGCRNLEAWYPVAPATRRHYEELRMTRFLHQTPRFQGGNDIAVLTQGTEEEAIKYRRGVKFMGILIWVLVGIWIVVVLYGYYTNRLIGWIVGIPQAAFEAGQVRKIVFEDEDANCSHPAGKTGGEQHRYTPTSASINASSFMHINMLGQILDGANQEEDADSDAEESEAASYKNATTDRRGTRQNVTTTSQQKTNNYNQEETFPDKRKNDQENQQQDDDDNTMLLLSSSLPQLRLQYRRRLRRCRKCVAFSTLLTLTSCCLIAAVAVPEFLELLTECKKDIPLISNIVASANNATREFLAIQRSYALNLLMDPDQSPLLGLCEWNTSIGYIALLNGSATELYASLEEGIQSLDSSLSNATCFIEQADQNVEAADDWIYLLVILFTIVLFILVGILGLSAYLATSSELKTMNRQLFVPFPGSNVLFLIMALLSIVFLYLATLSLYYSHYLGDLCEGDPDEQVARLINAPPPMDRFVDWYLSGCAPESRPVILFRLIEVLATLLIQVTNLLTLIAEVPILNIICDFISRKSIGELLLELEVDLTRLLVLAADLIDSFECSRVAPVFKHLEYETTCDEGIEAVFYVALYMLPASVFGMMLLTLRLAWMKVEAQLVVEEAGDRNDPPSNFAELESNIER